MKNCIIPLLMALAIFNTISIAADVHINDGGVYSLNDDTYSSSHLILDDIITPPFPGTHVDVEGDGDVGEILSYNNSSASIKNGSVWEVWAYDSSTIAISGGTTWQVYASNDSKVNMSSGKITGYLFARDNSTIIMSGGSVDIFIRVEDNGMLYLGGSNFKVNGFALENGDRLSNFAKSGTITGILADGSIFNTDFNIYNTGSNAGIADIVIVPEPTSLVLVGLGSLMLRRRKA